jgi:hypothetical protein
MDDYKVVMVFDRTENFDYIFDNFYQKIVDNNRYFMKAVEHSDELVLAFTVPAYHKGDYDMFKIGRYSAFTQKYKDIIASFFGRSNNTNNHEVKAYDIIYPVDSKRKQIAEWLSYKDSIIDYKTINEVYDSPNLELEKYYKIDDVEPDTNSSEEVKNASNTDN